MIPNNWPININVSMGINRHESCNTEEDNQEKRLIDEENKSFTVETAKCL